ncbi:hypothetical protein OIU77_010167 [Salix suchowensis]|uniref:Uncharacterized protein n=1 Tax=Salix suchowensis TaxID=1278906 RepID=A0ABQ9A7C9_9ROSI|nr:hypothetical protein OIU77_010167 [Salix suchowensis]
MSRRYNLILIGRLLGLRGMVVPLALEVMVELVAMGVLWSKHHSPHLYQLEAIPYTNQAKDVELVIR